MKAQRGSIGITTLSLTSALDGGGWLTGAENLVPTGIRSPDSLVLSKSLYRPTKCSVVLLKQQHLPPPPTIQKL
jgi:hypothetical protein